MNVQITKAFLLFMIKYAFIFVCLCDTNDYHKLHNYFLFMVKKFHSANMIKYSIANALQR